MYNQWLQPSRRVASRISGCYQLRLCSAFRWSGSNLGRRWFGVDDFRQLPWIAYCIYNCTYINMYIHTYIYNKWLYMYVGILVVWNGSMLKDIIRFNYCKTRSSELSLELSTWGMLTNHQVIIAHALPPFVSSFENLRASADSILKPGMTVA